MTHELGTILSAAWTLPFAGMLLSIALFPLFAPRFWHHHYPKITLFWALALAIPFVSAYRGEATHHLLEVLIADYFPFLVILWALYITASGIFVTASLHGTPGQNALLMLVGTVAASWIGTTGASIVMIRPLIRAIAGRKHRVHTIVFFIFMVSNAGGLLTPIGDPPLFLGFLHGVPFFWTLRLLPMLLTVAIPLLVVYYVLDLRYYRREGIKAPKGGWQRPGIAGWQNLAALGAIVTVVVLSGALDLGSVNLFGVECTRAGLLRDAALLLIGTLSLRMTPDVIHRENEFSWAPIKEVAILFAGIFVTMIPALAILRAGEAGALHGVVAMAREPVHYFWLSGTLSSFLDNAPTYLTFFNTALGALEPGRPEAEAVPYLLTTHAAYLKAISCGSVFMGANTYIGNAPNFLVKHIAEGAGIKMPSFFGYMLKYSIPVLIPLFAVVALVFFR